MAKISDKIIEECKKMYVEGHIPCAQIAKHFGIGAATIRRRLKELGIKIIQHPHAGKFEVSEVIKLYEEGTQIWKIAQIFKSSEETISKVLKENNIEVGVKAVFDNHIFDIIDTEEKAYWLGFIWADGSIITHNEVRHTYAFELGISIKDYEHLEKFCDFAKIPKERIKVRNEKNYVTSNSKIIHSGKSCRVQLSNKHFWNTLNNLGCCPNKTRNEKFPNIEIFSSPDLVHHFIRGVVDGDGWIYIDNRNYLISGICGQEDFLKELITYLPESLQTISLYDNISDVIKTAKWASNKAITFINYLYKDSNIHLNRKFNIAAPYIREGISKSGNIGETPEMDNTEITSKITKGLEVL